jgi:hypothetical protein
MDTNWNSILAELSALTSRFDVLEARQPIAGTDALDVSEHKFDLGDYVVINLVRQPLLNRFVGQIQLRDVDSSR